MAGAVHSFISSRTETADLRQEGVIPEMGRTAEPSPDDGNHEPRAGPHRRLKDKLLAKGSTCCPQHSSMEALSRGLYFVVC